MNMCRCGHDVWDHELVDESYDSLIFGRCKCDGCLCEQLEDR